MNEMHIRSSAMTHPGTKRGHNEDAYVDRPDLGLWAVADGAGGHHAGEVASGMIREALESIPSELSASELLAEVRLRVGRTHETLREMASGRGPGVVIASTIVAVLVRNEHFACLWAGDSRAYLLRGGVLKQISRDHSLVQEMVDGGMLTPEQAEKHPRANVITRAVGADLDDFEMEKVSDRLQPGDRLLLCSDGLCKTLSDDAMTELLGGETLVPPPNSLVTAALQMNATDNVTAVALEVLG